MLRSEANWMFCLYGPGTSHSACCADQFFNGTKWGLWRLSVPMVARVIVGRDVDGCIEHIG